MFGDFVMFNMELIDFYEISDDLLKPSISSLPPKLILSSKLNALSSRKLLTGFEKRITKNERFEIGVELNFFLFQEKKMMKLNKSFGQI